ncbi:MAG: hypothetical protein PWR31_941 [Bacillota bacterium]|nr:hypothetical protein [Bacillota bacterium]
MVKFLAQLSCDAAFRRKVAYVRAYYLHESPLLAEES